VKRARELCDRHQVHLVLDEIAVGFGRTGTLFAHEQAGIRPDFLCLSKGLTGGTLPLSVVLTTDAVYAAFYDDEVARGFLHSHSYTCNPLACRAALATLDLFAQTDALHQNLGTSERLAAQFAPISKHPRVRFDRRKGMVFAWHVLSTPARLRPPLCLPRAGAGAAAAPHRPHDLRHLIDDALVRQ
jgi:adenosylmethionine-8-amino-7-oxononanoate aminotransferase